MRSIKAHCLRCRDFQAVTMQTVMSDIPKERLAYQSPPFTNNGVDYFGPFYVTVRRTTMLLYAVLRRTTENTKDNPAHASTR